MSLYVHAESKKTFVQEFGGICTKRVQEAVREGENGNINGDNLDSRIKTNYIRMNNKGLDTTYCQ